MSSNPERLTDRKRLDIVEAAIAAFAEQGFDNASMDSIALRASVSKRTVYNHFSSKDQLFEEIVRRLREKATNALPLAFDPTVPLYDQLFEFCKRTIAFNSHPDQRTLCRILISRFIHAPELGHQMLGKGKVFEQTLLQWIDAASQAGQLQDVEPEIASRQLTGMMDSFCVWPQVLLNEETLSLESQHKIAAATVRMFLSAYGSPPLVIPPLALRPDHGA